MSKNEKTTIQILKETRDDLTALGSKKGTDKTIYR